jgi:hypothetical protein
MESAKFIGMKVRNALPTTVDIGTREEAGAVGELEDVSAKMARVELSETRCDVLQP